mmetsp:Transcript_8727/g.12450  ORF Transcript_8727/g.12450 Transcript_8727/m.12450 type:complete len:448 (+) Transcript_8727:69-1412(+)
MAWNISYFMKTTLLNRCAIFCLVLIVGSTIFRADLFSFQQSSPIYFPRTDNKTSKYKFLATASERHERKKEDEAEGFAACLLTSDDNINLPEWLAYHYTMLPLRYLVILNDPGSKTSPLEVVQRWDDIAEGKLRYWLWNESDVMDASDIKLAEQMLNEGGVKAIHNRLKLRQTNFIRKCNLFFQQQNLTWVTHVDTDELIVINRINPYDYKYLSNVKDHKENELSFSIPNTTMREIIDFRNYSIPSNPMVKFTVSNLMKIAHKQFSTMGGCYGMPRLRISSKEDEVNCTKVSGEASSSLQLFPKKVISSLESIRFVQSAKRDDFDQNRWGKAMVDVSSWSEDTLMKRVKNVHRPIFPECPKPVVPATEALLVVHHYIGSLERHLSRSNDTRYTRTADGWKERNIFKAGYEDTCDMHIDAWFDKFVEEVGGAKQAAHLLGWKNNITID